MTILTDDIPPTVEDKCIKKSKKRENLIKDQFGRVHVLKSPLEDPKFKHWKNKKEMKEYKRRKRDERNNKNK